MLSKDIHYKRLRASGSVSILAGNNTAQSEIDLNAKLKAIAVKATVYREINVCLFYILPNNIIDKSELNKLIAYLPKSFIILGDVKSNNIILGNKKKCLFNEGSQRYFCSVG